MGTGEGVGEDEDGPEASETCGPAAALGEAGLPGPGAACRK